MTTEQIRETILRGIRNSLLSERERLQAIMDRPEPMGSTSDRLEWWQERQRASRDMGNRYAPYTPDQWFPGGMDNATRIKVCRELKKMHREGVIICANQGGNRTSHVRLREEMKCD